MKKAYISPVTSLLVSLLLALGILVGDLSGYKLLTSTHAQQNPCGSGNSATLVSKRASIGDGIALSGIIVRDINVDGIILNQAVIASSIQLIDATLVGTTGIVYANGVYVGGDNDEAPTANGVYVGGDEGAGTPCVTGVYVGGDNDEAPTANGVYVGGDNDEVSLGGATVSSSGAATGGTLTGDNITITDGVITGQNLLLSGATIDRGSIGGAFRSVRIKRRN